MLHLLSDRRALTPFTGIIIPSLMIYTSSESRLVQNEALDKKAWYYKDENSMNYKIQWFN